MNAILKLASLVLLEKTIKNTDSCIFIGSMIVLWAQGVHAGQGKKELQPLDLFCVSLLRHVSIIVLKK
jgi:hypothetical protein